MDSNWDFESGNSIDTVKREVRDNGNIVWTRTTPDGHTSVKTIIVRDGKQVGCFSTGGSVTVR